MSSGFSKFFFLVLLLIGSLKTFAVDKKDESAKDVKAIVPKLNLEFWNKDPQLTENNNCYNYSTNRVTNDFAQPGSASKAQYKKLTCKAVYEAASLDWGLTPTKFIEFKEKEDVTLIALVVDAGRDFHWYRRDDNGLWTHKMGWLKATTFDNNRKLIQDPEKADRGTYKDFCGYFKIESFPLDKEEQNAGYVRIGGMKELPEVTKKSKKSKVIVDMYSGRPNPEFSLHDLLAKKQFQAEMENLKVQSLSTTVQGLLEREALINEFSDLTEKLGYRGIVIVDEEGLIYPAGSTVKVHQGLAVSSIEGRENYFKTKSGAEIEKLVLDEVKK